MNLPPVLVRAAFGALLASIGGKALSLPGPRMVGHFDFGYAIREDRAARPVQVFDDGSGKVNFEVRPGQPMPAVFAGRALDLLALQAEGPFFSAHSGASEFTLAFGAARATVARGDAALGGGSLAVDGGTAQVGVPGSSRRRLLASAGPGLPVGVRFDTVAAPAPRNEGDAAVRSASSYAVPVRGDLVEWVDPDARHTQPIAFAVGSAVLGTDVRGALGALAVRIGQGSAVIVEGRGDASGKKGLAEARANALRDALVARGLAAADITTHVGVTVDDAANMGARGRVAGAAVHRTTPGRAPALGREGAEAGSGFDIRPSDVDVAGALRRWARGAGYEVVWDLDWTAPITGTAHLDASSFKAAIEEVVSGLRAQGYPVRARSYPDHVIRFSAPE
jgi:outer membrane protein OmpA-like peptidoglycan-associated protein